MTRAQMLAELRYVLNEKTTNITWQESTLLGYLAEGQDKFCEDTGFFVDSSAYALTLEEGVAIYDIPSRIIQIMDIWNGTKKLTKKNLGEDFTVLSGPGTPTEWRTDLETQTISVSPTPTADDDGDEFIMQTWRYSLYDLAGDGPEPEGGGDAPDAEPELPSRFHRACIEWAAYKAFSHHDVEAQDPVKAADHFAAYKMYVSDGIAAFRRLHNYETRITTNCAYRT